MPDGGMAGLAQICGAGRNVAGYVIILRYLDKTDKTFLKYTVDSRCSW
jgi:hypothetical protein